MPYGFSDAFMKAHPDIRKIVDQATAGSWEDEKFLDEIRKTSWWKSQSDAQKRYDAEIVDNPGQVGRNVSQMVMTIRNLATRMGFNTKSAISAANALARAAVRNGWSEEEIRYHVGSRYARGEGPGMIGQTRSELKEMAGNYGVKVSPQNLTNITKAVLRGIRTTEDYEVYFRDHAKRNYAAISAQLDQGFTTRQILDPYLQQAAEELGVNPATMNITDGKWTAAIQYRPKGESAPRTMTQDEWTAKLRTDKNYGYDGSQNGQKAAATFGAEMMRLMGAMG